MNHRLLGNRTGLRVSELALGTGRIGTGDGPTFDRDAARDLFRAFAEAGGTFIDTSSAYHGGRSEEMLGDCLAESDRDQFVISTKYSRTPHGQPSIASIGNHRKGLRAEVEASLRRLRTDHIDLYFPHFDDGLTPIEEIMRGLDDLVSAGKILYIGLTNFPAWRIASAAMLNELRGWAPVAVVQLQYNLLERTADREYLPMAEAYGMGVMSYSPLGGGLLGRPASMTAGYRSGPVDTDHDGGQDAIVGERGAVAAEVGAEPVSVSLAWLLTKGITPVIGPRSVSQLAGNLAGVTVRLSDEQVRRIDRVSAPAAVAPYGLLGTFRESTGLTDPRSGVVR